MCASSFDFQHQIGKAPQYPSMSPNQGPGVITLRSKYLMFILNVSYTFFLIITEDNLQNVIHIKVTEVARFSLLEQWTLYLPCESWTKITENRLIWDAYVTARKAQHQDPGGQWKDLISSFKVNGLRSICGCNALMIWYVSFDGQTMGISDGNCPALGLKVTNFILITQPSELLS